MSEPDTGEMLLVGRITGCHGIKGWVKIHSFTEPAENFLGFSKWVLKRRDGIAPVEFDAGRRQGKNLIAHIVGVDDRTLAESYRGLEVMAPADSLPELAQGEYYWHQLQGLRVWCRPPEEAGDRVLLGEVDYLIETGANDVLVIKACEGSVDQRERLVPYLPGDVVSLVDLEQGVMEIDWFPDE